MNCVSLICTVHDEIGLANVAELRAILERIRPEVIFLEVPRAAYDEHHVIRGQQNLESRAVRQYRESHQVELVPVDLPTPDADFFGDTFNLRKSVWEVSPEYRRLKKCTEDYVSAYGLAYLNGEDYGQHCSDMDAEMKSVLDKMNDSRLNEVFELWNKTNHLREQEWMKRILEYCRGNTFNKGVFLVGAAHRQAIIDKSREQSATSPTRIKWDFADCQMTRHI